MSNFANTLPVRVVILPAHTLQSAVHGNQWPGMVLTTPALVEGF